MTRRELEKAQETLRCCQSMDDLKAFLDWMLDRVDDLESGLEDVTDRVREGGI